jgi:hypothetical protein
MSQTYCVKNLKHSIVSIVRTDTCPGAEAAGAAGDYSLVVQESQAAAQAASGAQQAFLGSDGGSIFLGTELPALLANPAVTTIEITF